MAGLSVTGMNGIASLLDPEANARVEAIWQDLERKCGLSGVRATPFPHFTWQVTGGYNLPVLEKVLRKFSKYTQPFTIHTDGLGVFSGVKPVIYISIFRDEYLVDLHSKLWEKTEDITSQPDPLYSPGQWVPHITLAYNDLTAENIGCAMQELAFRDFKWDIQINNLIFIGQTGEQTVESGKFILGQK